MSDRKQFFALLWTLMGTTTSAQVPGDLRDPMTPGGPSSAAALSGPGYHLTGTLISPSGRVAIINGTLSREGDRVDGADILAIDAGVVHMRTGSQELTVYLGARTSGGKSSSQGGSRQPRTSHSHTGPNPAAASMPSQSLPSAGLRTHGPVKRGETLSGIARRHLRDDITIDQMMIALFRANPEAFSDNINVLHEGAVLRIPDGAELRSRPPAVATAEVARQARAWGGGHPLQAHNETEPTEVDHYGPVVGGETLSGISEHVLRAGVTRHQTMIAMFRANPQAFSGNINVLHEGAVLRIPDGAELRSQSPGLATAEVVRQTVAWRSGSWRQARLTAAPQPGGARLADWVASTDGLDPPT